MLACLSACLPSCLLLCVFLLLGVCASLCLLLFLLLSSSMRFLEWPVCIHKFRNVLGVAGVFGHRFASWFRKPSHRAGRMPYFQMYWVLCAGPSPKLQMCGVFGHGFASCFPRLPPRAGRMPNFQMYWVLCSGPKSKFANVWCFWASLCSLAF